MTLEQLAKVIYKDAYLTGEFTLRSGQISNEYFDKYLYESKPQTLAAIAKHMLSLIPTGTQVLAGLEMGGIPIATALSFESGIPAAFVRKKAKTYGTCKLAEGAEIAGKQVLIIEDNVTTGGQIIKSARELRARGATVDHVLCVVLRGENAAELLRNEGLTLTPLLTMEGIKHIAQNV